MVSSVRNWIPKPILSLQKVGSAECNLLEDCCIELSHRREHAQSEAVPGVKSAMLKRI